MSVFENSKVNFHCFSYKRYVQKVEHSKCVKKLLKIEAILTKIERNETLIFFKIHYSKL